MRESKIIGKIISKNFNNDSFKDDAQGLKECMTAISNSPSLGRIIKRITAPNIWERPSPLDDDCWSIPQEYPPIYEIEIAKKWSSRGLGTYLTILGFDVQGYVELEYEVIDEGWPLIDTDFKRQKKERISLETAIEKAYYDYRLDKNKFILSIKNNIKKRYSQYIQKKFLGVVPGDNDFLFARWYRKFLYGYLSFFKVL